MRYLLRSRCYDNNQYSLCPPEGDCISAQFWLQLMHFISDQRSTLAVCASNLKACLSTLNAKYPALLIWENRQTQTSTYIFVKNRTRSMMNVQQHRIDLMQKCDHMALRTLGGKCIEMKVLSNCRHFSVVCVLNIHRYSISNRPSCLQRCHF